MKFIHLGDLHLGKSLGDFDLIEDQAYILKEIISVAKKEHVDAILIAGDVYDKAIPSEKAVHLFDEFLRNIVAIGVKAFVISGNHDSDERLQFGSSLFESEGVYIYGKYDGSLHSQALQDQFGEVKIYMLPFVKASYVRNQYPEEKIENYEDAVKVAIAKENVDYNARNIILSHQFVAGHSEPSYEYGSESIATQHVGNVEKVSVDCYERFDYVALGHIHSAMCLERESVRYSGVPLKYSIKEIGKEQTIPLVTMKEKGTVKIELVPLKPLRNVRHIKGKMQVILKEENVMSCDDYIYVTLTDDDVIVNAMNTIRNTYPNVIKLDYDNSHIHDMEQIDITDVTSGRTYEDLIQEFYQMIFGMDISEEELAIMKNVGKEAGVINETD